MNPETVVRAQRGDRGAFDLLAGELAEPFLAAARRILRDLDLAQDAAQQSLLDTWRFLPQLRDPARFEAWAYRLLIRACYAEVRRERRFARNLRVVPTDPPPTADAYGSVIDRDELDIAFRRLTVDHRAILVLHLYLDQPLDRAAEILGIPVGTAHSRLHHAVRALRGALEADARSPLRETVG
jgi:RNA polymerase sigma-70 factor (ECF subfamily)